jgi:hypothetical protein
MAEVRVGVQQGRRDTFPSTIKKYEVGLPELERNGGVSGGAWKMLCAISFGPPIWSCVQSYAFPTCIAAVPGRYYRQHEVTPQPWESTATTLCFDLNLYQPKMVRKSSSKHGASHSRTLARCASDVINMQPEFTPAYSGKDLGLYSP